MQQLNAAFAIAAATVILLGLISRRVQTLPVSRPLLAVAAGVVAGPLVLGVLRPAEWGMDRTLLKEMARLTLAIAVTGIAIRTPPADFVRFARPVGLLLTLGMVVMWLVSSAIGWAGLALSPLAALAFGAAVTPTDPVVASSVVAGSAAEKILPDRLRSTLSLESGANDGLGYLFVMLPLSFALHADRAMSYWLWEVVVVGVLLAVAIGAAIGWTVAWLSRRADHTGWVENHSLLGLTIAMSVLSVSGAKLLGSDGILAAFAAGAVFNLNVDRREDLEEQNVQETIAKLFNLPVFLVFGVMLSPDEWVPILGPLVLTGVGILLLRRPLALAVTGPFLGAGLTRPDMAYLGWFGPIGVAAIYYALHVEERLHAPIVWHATSFVVALSILLHGVTSGPGLKLYARAARGGG